MKRHMSRITRPRSRQDSFISAAGKSASCGRSNAIFSGFHWSVVRLTSDAIIFRYISCTGRLRRRASTMASPAIAPECRAQLMPSPIMFKKPAA